MRDYKFQIDKNYIQVIPGKLEGIYSWIAINYVLGRFQQNSNDTSESDDETIVFVIDYVVAQTHGHSVIVTPKRQSTVGVLDMGGASAQIACRSIQT
jgi:Golgi nucleoside diphosphatase